MPDPNAIGGMLSVTSVVGFLHWRVNSINSARADVQTAKSALAELQKEQVEGKTTQAQVEQAKANLRELEQRERKMRELVNVGPLRVNLTPPGVGVSAEERGRQKQNANGGESFFGAVARLGVMFALISSAALALTVMLVAISVPRHWWG